MVTNMFVGDPPGNYDRLLDYSRAVTGTLFFVPSADFLENVAAKTAPVFPSNTPEPDEHQEKDNANPRSLASDGSLGIGSLKEGSRRE